jgi:hypothetical protein
MGERKYIFSTTAKAVGCPCAKTVTSILTSHHIKT